MCAREKAKQTARADRIGCAIAWQFIGKGLDILWISQSLSLDFPPVFSLFSLAGL